MIEVRYTKTLQNTIEKLNLTAEEKIQTIICLYINSCSSEDCAKLFRVKEEKIIKLLQSEDIYNYQACSKCGKLRDRVKEFRQYDNRRVIVCSHCEKELKQEYDKEYNKNNKEKRNKYSREYNESNKEKLKEYKENNKEKLKEYYKEYHKNNKKKKKDYYKEYYQKEASIEYIQKLANFEEVSGNQIRCKYCGRWMIPTIIQVHNRLQGIDNNDTCYIYCSEECKQECPVYDQKKYPKNFKPASSREVDPVLRKLVLERDEYTCQRCGESQDELEVGLHCHHITPVANSPIEANDMDNCITLCKNCHKEVHQIPGCGYNELRCEK